MRNSGADEVIIPEYEGGLMTGRMIAKYYPVATNLQGWRVRRRAIFRGAPRVIQSDAYGLFAQDGAFGVFLRRPATRPEYGLGRRLKSGSTEKPPRNEAGRPSGDL